MQMAFVKIYLLFISHSKAILKMTVGSWLIGFSVNRFLLGFLYSIY